MNSNSDNLIETLIQNSTIKGVFNDALFIQNQCNSNPNDRHKIRNDSKILKYFFNLALPELDKQLNYYFWDTTTLAMKQPLSELMRPDLKVLEIGPGPAATLSLFLLTHYPSVFVDCAEINEFFYNSAKKNVQKFSNRSQIFLTDMGSSIPQNKKYDLIFMNPPYVKQEGIINLNIHSGTSESFAGYAGDDGTLVLRSFLKEVPNLLLPNGLAVIGINTRHLENEKIIELINDSAFKLVREYYPSNLRQPNGPFSQVYLLTVDK